MLTENEVNGQPGTYEDFRRLLHKGLSGMKQAELAERSGISPEHLNRMLNQPEISRPKLKTLEKLSKAVRGGVTLSDLMKSCGYYSFDSEMPKQEEPAESRQEVLDRRAKAAHKAFFEGLSEFLKRPSGNRKDPSYASVHDFLEIVYRIYGTEDFSFQILFEHDGCSLRNADRAALIDVQWMDSLLASSFFFVLYYDFEDDQDSDGIRPVGFTVDMQDIAAEHFVSEKFCASYLKSHPDKSYYLYQSDHGFDSKEKTDRMMRMFQTMSDKYETTIVGYGFDAVGIPPRLVRFIVDHSDTFLSLSGTSREMYLDLVHGKDPEQVLAGYETKDGTGDATGVWALVNDIMESETKFSFLYMNDEDAKALGSNPCIMVPEDDYRGSLFTLSEVVARYARELRLPHCGNIYYKTAYYKEAQDDLDFTYEDDEEPSGDMGDGFTALADAKPSGNGIYTVLLYDGRVFERTFYFASASVFILHGIGYRDEVLGWKELPVVDMENEED